MSSDGDECIVVSSTSFSARSAARCWITSVSPRSLRVVVGFAVACETGGSVRRVISVASLMSQWRTSPRRKMSRMSWTSSTLSSPSLFAAYWSMPMEHPARAHRWTDGRPPDDVSPRRSFLDFAGMCSRCTASLVACRRRPKSSTEKATCNREISH